MIAANSTTVVLASTADRARSGARRTPRSRTNVAPGRSGARAPSVAGPRGARSPPAASSRTAAPRGLRCSRRVPYLRLIDSVTHDVTEIRDPVARLGRSPDCRVIVTGPGAGVVSALHAELRFADGDWRLADLGSRNGTYVNERRLHAPVALRSSDVIGLGESGPRFEVAAVTERPPLPATLPDRKSTRLNSSHS